MAFRNLIDVGYFKLLRRIGLGLDNLVIYNKKNAGWVGEYILPHLTPIEPLSAYVFILAFDILLIQIRENADIKGILVHETEIKL